MQDSELTPRQEEFCQQWMIDRVGVAAAIRAGYSEKTAHVQATRLLKNDKIKARIADLQEATAARNDVTLDEVITMLRDSYREAKLAGQHGPAVRAAELLGKRLGLFVDRMLVGEVEQLSDDELIKHIAGGDPRRAALAWELLGAPNSFDTAETRH